jgi:DNA-binding transcriptional ArsR family regulator
MAIFKTEPLDRVFHALGDATRRGMLSMLADTEQLSASELAAPFAISQPTASKHIKVLEESALVERIVEGRTHNFRLRREALSKAESWLNRHTRFWAGSMGRLGRYVKTLPADKER